MKVSISQPTLFPWIGYFDMIKECDVFVFLDNVEFKKQTWHMRNRLKNGSKIEDSEIWVHIPTKLPKTRALIKDVLIDNNQNWKQKHLDIFQSNYGKKYKKVSFLQELYQEDWNKIADFNIKFIAECCKYLNISTKLVLASELDVEGKKSQLVLNICKQMKAAELFANNGSRDYLEEDREIFIQENIRVSYQMYTHPIYNQRGNAFLDHLSVLDLLFSELENSKKFI
ncbi:WbqC family protein [Maribacter sp. CXY002]|uniref:WbqC family protein n=1 Tax=Maribacter luteocoastalis TaxID=3407671 RepID=UPI003B683319